MITGIIQLTSVSPATGPYYIYSNVDGYSVPFLSNISQGDLLAGYPTDAIPDGTTIVRIRSLNDVCNNYVNVVVPPMECYQFLPENSYMLSQINKADTGYFYGYFTDYRETGVLTNTKHLVKLNIDLTIDDSFDVDTGFNEILYSGSTVLELADGKLIVTGTFTFYKGIAANRIIRLNTDGSRDNTFDIGTGFNNYTQQPAVDSLGRIVVTGLYSTYKGVSSNRLIRLNPDGSKDTSLVIGSGFDNATLSILINPDDTMYITGYYNTYNGNAHGGLIKLFSDGSVDTSFVVGPVGLTPNTNFHPTYLSRIAGQESFFAAGYFTAYKGVPEPHIIKIDKFGNKDTSFSAGTGFNGDVFYNNIVWGNKIMLIGTFTSYNGVSANSKFIILNADGSVLYSETSADVYNTPIVIGDNLFAAKSGGGCLELLYSYAPGTTTTSTTVAPTTTTTTTAVVTTTTTTVVPTTTTTTTGVCAHAYDFWLGSGTTLDPDFSGTLAEACAALACVLDSSCTVNQAVQFYGDSAVIVPGTILYGTPDDCSLSMNGYYLLGTQVILITNGVVSFITC